MSPGNTVAERILNACAPPSRGNTVEARILNQPTQKLMAMIKTPRNEHKMPSPPAPEGPQAMQLHQVEHQQYAKVKQERVEHEAELIDFRARAQPTQRPDQPREEKNKIMKHHIDTTQRMQKQSQRMHEDHMRNQTRMMAALESQAKVVTPGTGAGVDTAGTTGLIRVRSQKPLMDRGIPGAQNHTMEDLLAVVQHDDQAHQGRRQQNG
jgi:hypothetical protein